MGALDFEESNDDSDTEEDTGLRWNNDEAVVSLWGNNNSDTDDCGGSGDNAGRSDAGAAVTANDSDDGNGAGDADADGDNGACDAAASDFDDAGDATANAADSSASDGAHDTEAGASDDVNDAGSSAADADSDAGDVANDADVGDVGDVGSDARNDADAGAGDATNDAKRDTGDPANDADACDAESDPRIEADAADGDATNDAKGDNRDAPNGCDDNCGDTAPNDTDADIEEVDNNMTWFSLGEVSVVGSKVVGLAASVSTTNCLDDAWIPDVWSCLGEVTSVSNAVLFVSLKRVVEILKFVWCTMLRLFVDAVKNGLVLLGDIARLFKIYSIPLHSSLWITNTFPTGQTKLANVFSGNSVSLTAMKE